MLINIANYSYLPNKSSLQNKGSTGFFFLKSSPQFFLEKIFVEWIFFFEVI